MPTSVNAPEGPRETEFRLTGRHVLMILVACFGIVFVVNGFMIWRAVASFPGVVTESSFRDSQRFNAEIAAARDQAARAWKVDATTNRDPDGTTRIRVEARDAEGKALSGISFAAILEHPADRARDHRVSLAPVAGTTDVWEGRATGVTAGKWGLLIEGDGAGGRLFLSQNTLFFE